MRIAFYVISWPPGFSANGIVTYASQIVPALRRLGHEVFVLTPYKSADHNDPYTIDLQAYASLPTFWARAKYKLISETADFNTLSSPIAAATAELAKRHQLDLIETEETFGLSFAISRLSLLPVVVRLHGPWFSNVRFEDPDVKKSVNRKRIKWEGRAIRSAEFVTAPTAATLRAVKNYYGFALTASRIISNPLDAAKEAEIWDANKCDTNRLLFVGRFDALKGGDLILRVFGELAASYPQLRLTFVGPDTGIKTADGKTQQFELFVRSNFPGWLQSRIEFCGEISHSEVMRLRSSHFATVVASQHETFSYLVLEAMSLGCPIVATAVGGIPELIQDEQNGLLVPSQDVNAMAAACKKLLDDHALAARLGRKAWLDCRDLYGPGFIAKQTVEAYEQAIKIFGNA